MGSGGARHCVVDTGGGGGGGGGGGAADIKLMNTMIYFLSALCYICNWLLRQDVFLSRGGRGHAPAMGVSSMSDLGQDLSLI